MLHLLFFLLPATFSIELPYIRFSPILCTASLFRLFLITLIRLFSFFSFFTSGVDPYSQLSLLRLRDNLDEPSQLGFGLDLQV